MSNAPDAATTAAVAARPPSEFAFGGFDKYLTKLSPQKGDILVLRIEDQHSLEALAQAQQIYGQLYEAANAGRFDKDIPLVILYGKDRLEAMGAEFVGQFALSNEPGICDIFKCKDGSLVGVPHGEKSWQKEP